MFIQTENTPNPNSLKFIPGTDVSPNNPVSFNTLEEASISPLAYNLLSNQNVESLFFGSDFITINKKSETSWDAIKPELLICIMEHFISKKPIFNDGSASTNDINENDTEIVKQIKEVIEARVRPAVANDGGDVVFNRFEDGIVYLEMRGACSGCPSSSYTLKEGIESMLKHYIPEVISVEQV